MGRPRSELALLSGGCRWTHDLLRRCRRLRLFLAFVLFAGGEDRVENRAFHARHELDHGDLADVLDEAIDDVVAEVAVGHLASAEAKAGLNFVAALQELDGLILFCLVVVFVHGYGELDLFDDDDLLLFARGALGLFLLVKEAAVVLNAADRRNGIR